MGAVFAMFNLVKFIDSIHRNSLNILQLMILSGLIMNASRDLRLEKICARCSANCSVCCPLVN